MDTATLAIIVAAGALLLNIGVHIFGGGWNLSNKLALMETALRKAIAESTAEIELRQDRMIRDTGESIAAIRQKLHEIETWARDEFVRREGFYKVRDELVGDLRTLSDKLDTRMDRMETKIDSKT